MFKNQSLRVTDDEQYEELLKHGMSEETVARIDNIVRKQSSKKERKFPKHHEWEQR